MSFGKKAIDRAAMISKNIRGVMEGGPGCTKR
jgi:hypothetical protein